MTAEEIKRAKKEYESMTLSQLYGMKIGIRNCYNTDVDAEGHELLEAINSNINARWESMQRELDTVITIAMQTVATPGEE